MVKTFSLKKDGNTRLEPNFRVKEFRCKDGSDTILIDTDLVKALQTIRDAMGLSAINISSGYRTKTYNQSIGGSATSKHCKGMAADFTCRRGLMTVPSIQVACMAETLGLKGIEVIDENYLHIDTRTDGTFWTVQYTKNGARAYKSILDSAKSFFTYGGISFSTLKASNPFPFPPVTLKKGDKNEYVRWLQWELIEHKFMSLLNYDGKCNIDGSFGNTTYSAFVTFQKKFPNTYYPAIAPDGHCGPNSRNTLKSL